MSASQTEDGACGINLALRGQMTIVVPHDIHDRAAARANADRPPGTVGGRVSGAGVSADHCQNQYRPGRLTLQSVETS